MFPSSKSQNHKNHKVKCGHTTALRMTAIYGANGAGKSNFVDALWFLKRLICRGSLTRAGRAQYFRFRPDCAEKPMGMAVEFCCDGDVFYYHIEFYPDRIVKEELLLSKESTDDEIFCRAEGELKIKSKFMGIAKNELFIEAMNKIVTVDMPLLSIIGMAYSEESAMVASAYRWFVSLNVMRASRISGFVPHMIDSDPTFSDFVNACVPEFKTGMFKVGVRKEEITEEEASANPRLEKAFRAAKTNKGTPQMLVEGENGKYANYVYENDVVYKKSLYSIHRGYNREEVEMPIETESDGTRRLIEYTPILYRLINKNAVFVVDEIERSIHPIMIKEIMRLISKTEMGRGQLIFTTHESCLLDQAIFRQDEIWFAQKDPEQATQLYPLSDYKIHKTANIENGYLEGRYGGIPFLSNLKDLSWQYDTEE